MAAEGIPEHAATSAYDERVSAPAADRGPAGLVVDWGGVLTASLDGAMEAWTRQDGIDHEHFKDVMRSWVGRPEPEQAEPEQAEQAEQAEQPVAELEQADDDGPAGQSPVHRLERGELSPPDFEVVLAAELERRGSPVEPAGLLHRMLGGLEKLDDDMLALARRARDRGVRTALLSNSWGNRYPEQLWDGLFDALVISGRVGMRKPEPRIYRHTCDLLGLPPERCVMVDDLEHNIAAAVAVGMIGVRHTSYSDTVLQLQALFEVLR
jgi:putative hydrolase of the HAD superfamily